MRYILFISVMFMGLHSEAQNIVPNGGFEEISNCPTSGGKIFWPPPWNRSANSPDLFNACGDFGYALPLNRYGFQPSRSGNGYAGFMGYIEIIADTREFVKCTLNYPLVANEEYYVEFHVSQADSFQFATHNLGVTFTDVDTGEFGELLCWPDCDAYVENTSANPLTSKTDWMKISGTFTAQGGERYIHIGNFRTDDDSEIEFVGGGTDPDVVWNQAYYYVDDVWLSHVDSAGYVGVGEVEDDIGFEVFPNPSVGGSISVKCNLKGGEVAELRVYDMSGRQVYSNNEVCGANAIELNNLSEGIYHCLLVVNGKASLSEKLVILRE